MFVGGVTVTEVSLATGGFSIGPVLSSPVSPSKAPCWTTRPRTPKAMNAERMVVSAAVIETTIDRTQFGITWNAPLPGGGNVLADEVKLTADLSLVKKAA